MAAQIKSIFYNIDLGAQSDAVGTLGQQSDIPLITLSQKDNILAIDFIRTGGDPVTDLFLANDVFGFAADNDFAVGTALKMQTTDAGFNVPGDRPDLDVPGGKISLKLDADTAELEQELGTDSELDLTGEIQVTEFGGSDPKAVFRFFMLARNLVNNASTPPSGTTSNFFNKAETLALLAGLNIRSFPVTGIDFKTPASFDLYTVPAGLRAKVISVEPITDAISGGGVGPTYKAKTDDGPRDISGTIVSTSDTVDEIMRFDISDQDLIPAGSKVQVEITSGSTFTTHSGRFVVTVQELLA